MDVRRVLGCGSSGGARPVENILPLDVGDVPSDVDFDTGKMNMD
jgi:hypothetical protein